ncbi:MAG TPA: pitrilysin family protein, partial [bacterium]
MNLPDDSSLNEGYAPRAMRFAQKTFSSTCEEEHLLKNLFQKTFLLLVLILFLVNFALAGVKEGEVVEHLLPNGLKVLTVEMHNAPIIFSQLSYKVGSRNELLGKTGISHLAEHMMFKGTKKFSKEAVKKTIKNNGGVFNAFMSNDITSYWEQAPKNKIDIVLEIESDRMQNCIFDPKEYLPERDVVIEERHMRTDDSPQGIFREELYAIAFKSHPLQNPIIGWPADLKSITRDDVYSYYKTYYTPNNATLVLVGDFQTDEMMKKVKKYFGKISRGPEVPPVTSVEIE